jgi:hypothetical protein
MYKKIIVTDGGPTFLAQTVRRTVKKSTCFCKYPALLELNKGFPGYELYSRKITKYWVER